MSMAPTATATAENAEAPRKLPAPDGPRPDGTGSGALRALLSRTWVQAAAVAAVLVLAAALPLPGSVTAFPAGPGEWLDGRLKELFSWVVSNRDTSPIFVYGFNYLGVYLGSAVVLINDLLTALTWTGVTVLGVLAAWRLAGWRVMLVVLAAFAVFGLFGLWEEAMETLALITAAVLLALLVGLPLGIWSGRSDRAERAMRPVLDFMQTMPAFAYLMPMLLMFGIGNPAAAVATAVYSLPPAVRITSMALRGVDRGAVEAAESLGSTGLQMLLKVRLPLAKRTIMLGVNQTIMLGVSMVVIASVIGAGGLGDAVYQALQKDRIGLALEAGLAIVMLAIAMDRVTGAIGHGRPVPPRWYRFAFGGGLLAALVVFLLPTPLRAVDGWPRAWEVDLAGPAQAFYEAMKDTIGPFTSALGDWTVVWVLTPLHQMLAGAPWWLVIAAAAVLGGLFAGRRAAVVGVLSLAAVGLMGQWGNGMNTLSQVLLATVLVIALGMVLGIAMSRSDRAAAVVRPVLDAMQTLPPFVYLIPAVALFSVGRVPALVAAVVFALPPVIRLVNDGIRGVPANTVEAARSLGSSRSQLLAKVQLPLARSSLLLAVNQAIMLILSMVVIGALVGGGALGYDVVFGLKQNEFGMGLTAGLAIVCLGLLLDRMTQGKRNA
ncbi:ABC transporter permease subunit [Nocardiopsis sp. LSu2-4]|uniref:ABC transporter permease subunit n=2 Tax=Nocardiopsis suaedae TaxID=3018444 RepID=A0ABT4TN93_9ACTN|nr:ABC transporter permease subunit [Nocardiopsis suaedae]MDA2805836.1 ABC transporter permease subunit [Nocardiopsis suaedae]